MLSSFTTSKGINMSIQCMLLALQCVQFKLYLMIVNEMRTSDNIPTQIQF